MLRTVPANVEYSKRSAEHPQVSATRWQELAECDGVLDLVAFLTTTAQYEAAWTGSYREIIQVRKVSNKMFEDASGLKIINIWAPSLSSKPNTKTVAADGLTALGKECKRRAKLEAHRRNTMVGGKMSCRDHLAILLDQRTVNSEVLSAEDRMDGQVLLEAEYGIYAEKFEVKRPTKEDKQTKTPIKTPPKGMMKHTECWSDLDSESDSDEDELDERLKLEFKESWRAWRKLHIDWHHRYPNLKQVQATRAQQEGASDAMNDLLAYIDLDLAPLYLDLLHQADEKLLGRFPLMALTVLGNNMAASFCERVNSAANLIMHHGRTLLKDEHLRKLCILRMNRDFIDFMKESYPKLATHVMSKANKKL